MSTAVSTARLDLPARADAGDLSADQRIGFELGWDYARYRLAPPAAYLAEASSLGDGLRAGRAVFGSRTLPASRWVRDWLQLRLTAWLRGRSVELLQVTPNYLQQIAASHCPITRQPLGDTATSIDRVRNDAGYAAGNLATMSTRANRAKGAHGWHGAQRRAAAAESAGKRIDGLDAGEWQRLAVLCSFVEPLPHGEAAAIPMRLLPPNRLRLFNPVQALQSFVSRQMLAPGWSARLRRFEPLLEGAPQRRAFQTFFYAFLPRVLEAGREADALQRRWAIEDAWSQSAVQQRWSDFARRLDAPGCERLLLRAQAERLASQRIDTFDETQSTEGWNLDSRGYVAPGPAAAGSPCLPRQESLPL